MQHEADRAIDNWEIFGISLDDIPALNRFIPVDELEHRPHVSAGPPDESDPDWVQAVWNCVVAVAGRCNIRPLIVEVAAIQDPRALSGRDPYFVSNVVCGVEAVGSEGSSPILDAYQAMVARVEYLGTSVEDPEFRETHYLRLSARGSPPNGGVSSHPTGTSAIRRRMPCAGELWRDSEITLLQHCRQFFNHFLEQLGEHRVPFARSHYIAIPFQRPERFAGVRTSDTDGRQLEPGGAMFLIIDPQDSELARQRVDIETFVTRMRCVLNEACKKESSLSLDLRIADSVVREQKLMAYDGIGHTLRAYVEATGYAGAANELREVLRQPNLTEEVRRRVAHALRSLSFFSHAEGLGSLMRLHGWVNQRQMHAEWPVSNKVLRCYYEASVEAVRRGERTAEVLTGHLRMVEIQANILATKDQVQFRIAVPELGPSAAREIPPGGCDPDRPPSPFTLPPLKTTGDEGAVLLALTVGLLEPLRNASMFLHEEKIRRAAARRFARPGGAKPTSELQVDVILRSHGSGCRIFIGNPLFGGRRPDFAGQTTMSGVVLVNSLLKEIRLAHIRESTAAEAQGQLPSAPDDREADALWLCVETHPLELFDFARSPGIAYGEST